MARGRRSGRLAHGRPVPRRRRPLRGGGRADFGRGYGEGGEYREGWAGGGDAEDDLAYAQGRDHDARFRGDPSRASHPRGGQRRHGYSRHRYGEDYGPRDYGGSQGGPGYGPDQGAYRQGMAGEGYWGGEAGPHGYRRSRSGYRGTAPQSGLYEDDGGSDVRRGIPSHRGRGPTGYRRSDERITEDVHECLTEDHDLDASRIQVRVKESEVTLDGTVDSREAKRHAERLIEDLSGVTHVQNNLRVTSSRDIGESGGAEPSTRSSFGVESESASSRSSARGDGSRSAS